MFGIDVMTIVKSVTGTLKSDSKLYQEPGGRNINSLPREMLFMIFQKLEFKHLKNVMLVSRHWRTLGGDPVLWKKFKLFVIKDPAYFVQILSMPRLTKLKHVTLDGLYEFRAKYSDWHFDFLRNSGLKILELDDLADLTMKYLKRCQRRQP